MSMNKWDTINDNPNQTLSLIQAMEDVGSQNCISHWLPLLQEKAAVPLPRTVVLHSGTQILHDLDQMLVNGPVTEAVMSFAKALDSESVRAFANPCRVFFRTGLLSGKHDWNNCCAVDRKAAKNYPEINWISHMAALHEMMHMAGFVGRTDAWAVREYLEVSSSENSFVCRAFGATPIVRGEFRLFVDGPEVTHWQPYWPSEALDGYVDEDSYPEWRERLRQASTLADCDRNVLGCFARSAGHALDGEWSIDFMHAGARGWILIDVARADESHVSPDRQEW